MLKRAASGGWDSQNDSGSGNLKAIGSFFSYPVASEALPPRSCKLRVAPVANWHSRQPPNALTMGLD